MKILAIIIVILASIGTPVYLTYYHNDNHPMLIISGFMMGFGFSGAFVLLISSILKLF